MGKTQTGLGCVNRATRMAKDVELNIRGHFENFLDNRIVATMDLSLSDFDINPFLIATVRDQLSLKTPRDLAEWLIIHRLERGIVTGFGSTLQNIAKEFSNAKSPPNITASIVRDDKIYNMIIKSGSNHNLSVARTIRHTLLSSTSKSPNAVPIFAICCGEEADINSIMKKQLEGIHILAGRHFWDFISQDPGCYKRILQVATDVGTSYRDPDIGTLGEAIRKKTIEIEAELKKIYGCGDDFWVNMLGAMY